MKKLRLLLVAMMLLVVTVVPSFAGNTSDMNEEQVYYMDGQVVKVKKTLIGMESSETAASPYGVMSMAASSNSTTYIYLYETTVIMKDGMFRPSVEMGAEVKVSYSGSFGQIVDIVDGTEYCREVNSGSYTYDTDYVRSSIGNNGLALNMHARGTLEVKNSYVFSIGYTHQEILDLGFDASGDYYTRERASVAVSIDLY